MRAAFLLLLLTLFLQSGLSGQSGGGLSDYALTDLAKELPDVRVSGVVRDSRGFMWISTANGLFRYDGVTFKSFKSSPHAEHRIGFNHIIRIILVFDHFLILEGDRKVDVLDINSEEIVYSSEKELVFLATTLQEEICLFHFEDEKFKTILFKLTPDGIVRPWDGPGINFRIDGICLNSRRDLYFLDRTGRLWEQPFDVNTPRMIDSITFQGRRVLYLPDLVCDKYDRVWLLDYLSTSGKSIIQLTADNRLKTVFDNTVAVTLLATGEQGVYWWFNTENRVLSRCDLNSGEFRDFLQLPEYAGRVDAVYLDEQGIFWIGSSGSGSGLLIAYPHLRAFHKLRATEGGEERMGMPCRGITELPNGDIYLGCNDGIFQFDPETATLTDLALKSETGPINFLWDFAPSLDHKSIWFTKIDRGIFEYRLGERETANYRTEGANVGNRILGITMDKDGLLWLGTQSGIAWFDTKTREFQYDPELSVRFYDVFSYRWVSTDDNTFWLCSSRGLYRFDSTHQIVAHYGIDTRPYLNTDEVFDIVGSGDRYWIATDNGLHVLSGDSIEIITVADGLAHDAIASVALDEDGQLWIATFRGLSKMDPETRNMESYYVEDGLPHNEFNRCGKHVAGDGTIYFGTQNGVVYFQPSEVEKSRPRFALVYTGFSTFGENRTLQSYSQEALNNLASVTIPAGNKYFQVDFALLNFINSAENKYTYYLEGLEEHWRPLTQQSFAQYNNLPPGTYRLHIRAQSPSGYWSDNNLNLRITVLEHFYQRSEFYAGLVLLIIAVIILITRYHYKQRLKMEQMRNRISSDLHDEVGGVLSGVAMQMDLMETRAPEDLRPFMKRVAESSRGAASKMRDVIWAIDSSKDKFQNLIDRIKAFTIEILGPLDIDHKIVVQGIDLQQTLSVAVRQNLYLIFKEALTNAMKHANASSIRITLTKEKRNLCLVVEDNGVGMTDNGNQQGQGMRNMYKRAERIGGQLTIFPGEDGGTVVRFEIEL